MNYTVYNNKCILDVRVCIITGHVTDNIQFRCRSPSHSSNAHAPDDRDARIMNYDTK